MAADTTSSTNPPYNSNLDAELFYELLVGEISIQAGDHASAFSLMMDAARKANSAVLYERAVEIALRARAGEAALEASQAWARAFPSSSDARRYQLQILIGLNRVNEAQEPFKRELASRSARERLETIRLWPRFFSRVTDKKLAANVIEKVLATELLTRTNGAAAWAAVGHMRLLAGETDAALLACQKGIALDGMSEDPIKLAIALLNQNVMGAEPLIQKYLLGKSNLDLRLAFANSLINNQRYTQAYAQTGLVTAENPEHAEAWLMHGALELQDGKTQAAESSIQKYIALKARTSDSPDAEKDIATPMEGGLVQAYLLLSQIAEQQHKFDLAISYLENIKGANEPLRIHRRHAAILARQGKVDLARKLIQTIPEQSGVSLLDKLNAESQLLRDLRLFSDAYTVLRNAMVSYPMDTDLQYDLAMVAEKLEKFDEMESLLRDVIKAKPDHHHAYNALGYSFAERNIHLPEARELIQKALSFAPQDPYILDSLAWVEFRSGDNKEAARILRAAFSTRPDAEIAAHLGEVLWTMGQHEEANAIWKQGMELNAKNETLVETIKRLRDKP